jgi:hypothetical protein
VKAFLFVLKMEKLAHHIALALSSTVLCALQQQQKDRINLCVQKQNFKFFIYVLWCYVMQFSLMLLLLLAAVVLLDQKCIAAPAIIGIGKTKKFFFHAEIVCFFFFFLFTTVLYFILFFFSTFL